MLKPLIAALSLMLSGSSIAQTAPAQAPPQLSPKAAYDQAMHPLDLTRSSFSNWSDTEVAALSVTIEQAAKACATRDPKTFTGPDLIDLAHLCSLGQNFPAVVESAQLYIAAKALKPLLNQAYASLIDAQLHLKDEPAALASAQAMLAAVPYDAVTAASFDQAITYMRFVHTGDALTLALARQPAILAALQTPPAINPQPIHDLYADGLDLAALQQLAKSPQADVDSTTAALDAALPTTLAPDDAIPIAASRRRYALLGKPLPDLAHPANPATPKHPVAVKSLLVPPEMPQLPAVNVITALLLFPDWCAQCVRMSLKLPPTVFTVSGHEAYLYALLAQTMRPNPTPSGPRPTNTPFSPADAAMLLNDTPTLVVDPSFLDQFVATDFPFFILTDSQGIVRVLQPVGEDALTPGSTIDSAIARVGANFPHPRSLPKPAPAATAQTP